MVMAFSSARIVTSDVRALASFYETVTGIAPSISSEDFVELRTGSGALKIASVRASVQSGANGAEPGANRTVIVEFVADDIDKEHDRLASIVRDWVMKPTTQPWGSRSMMFRDPEGNLVNIYRPAHRHVEFAA